MIHGEHAVKTVEMSGTEKSVGWIRTENLDVSGSRVGDGRLYYFGFFSADQAFIAAVGIKGQHCYAGMVYAEISFERIRERFYLLGNKSG